MDQFNTNRKYSMGHEKILEAAVIGAKHQKMG